jgi:adenylate kinase family enzyme
LKYRAFLMFGAPGSGKGTHGEIFVGCSSRQVVKL